MREQIMNLLAGGASQADTLRITGVSQDLLTELLNDKGFLIELKDKREANRQELIVQGYAKLEQTAINQLVKEAGAGMLDAAAMCKVLETAAKNRVLHSNPAGTYTNNTLHLSVELKMPQGANNAGVVIDSTSGQIVAIGDRNMTAMPAQTVQKLFKQIDKEGFPKQDERAIIDADLDINSGDDDGQADEARPTARAA